MNENNGNKKNHRSNKSLSVEEKRNYCVKWKKSGMNQLDFSKANGISKAELYQWNKKFEQENNKRTGFSPITLKDNRQEEESGIIQLNIDCPNHLRLSISIPEYRLITFIQEIGYATSAIW